MAKKATAKSEPKKTAKSTTKLASSSKVPRWQLSKQALEENVKTLEIAFQSAISEAEKVKIVKELKAAKKAVDENNSTLDYLDSI